MTPPTSGKATDPTPNNRSADWKLSAQGTAMEVMVKPFGGVDPTDEAAAKCLRNALQNLQMACPRDAKVHPVRTAICL